MERFDHPTNLSESSDKAGAIDQGIIAPAAAISCQQPDHPIQQEDEVRPSKEPHRRSYYDEPIFRPQLHSLKNDNDEAQLLKSSTPEANKTSLLDNTSKHKTHLRILTYGSVPPWVFDINVPILFKADLRDLEPPPLKLQDLYTGLNKEIADHFWSLPEHETAFQIAMAKIKGLVSDLKPGDPGEFAVLVNCFGGTHRSVVFALRLHRELGRWRGVTTSIVHCHLRQALENRRARVRRHLGL